MFKTKLSGTETTKLMVVEVVATGDSVGNVSFEGEFVAGAVEGATVVGALVVGALVVGTSVELEDTSVEFEDTSVELEDTSTVSVVGAIVVVNASVEWPNLIELHQGKTKLCE